MSGMRGAKPPLAPPSWWSAYGMLSNALREALDIMLPEVLTELFYEGLVFECCDMQYLLAYYKLVD